MSSYQKVIIMGNVGKDPEVRYTGSGTAVCSLSVATSRKWKDKSSGEMQEDTEWHRCVAYDRLAEIIGEYVKKGHPIFIDGRLKTRKWEDKQDVTHYTTEIICESIQLMGRREDGEDRPQRRAAPQGQKRQSSQGGTGFDDMDDDIPF